MSVVAPVLFAAGRLSIVPSVAQRYARMTTTEPQNRYFLIARMWTSSTPMFSGTSIPSNARMTRPNSVHVPECGHQLFAVPKPPVAECPSPMSHRIPARPMTKIAAAKKPQKGPSAFCVQTYSEPSCGNISPSCAVTSAPGIRKATKPRIQNVYAEGPARWIAEAFTMNRTIATKMIVMSAEFRTRGSMPGAIRSEIIWRSSAGATAAIHHLRVGCAGIFALEARFDQEPGEERRAHGDGVEEDVLVARVRSAALSAEPVEHRDAERAH